MQQKPMKARTVKVENVSDLAGESEIGEFFSFSGEIEHIQILPTSSEDGRSRRSAFVTFKDPRALEIALLLSGATLVDQIVIVSLADNYVPKFEEARVEEVDHTVFPVASTTASAEVRSSPSTSGHIHTSKAQEVVSGLLAKGSAIGQDAMNKAKAFDEKHQLTANASAKFISFERRVGLSDKISNGFSVVNEKVKSMDQKLHVSDKTMAAMIVAERKMYDTGSAVKTNRYVSAGTTWISGAFSKVGKVGHVAGSKTREKFQFAVSNLTAKEPAVIV